MSAGQIFYAVQLLTVRGEWADESRHRKKAAAIKAYEWWCRRALDAHERKQIRLVLCEVLP